MTSKRPIPLLIDDDFGTNPQDLAGESSADTLLITNDTEATVDELLPVDACVLTVPDDGSLDPKFTPFVFHPGIRFKDASGDGLLPVDGEEVSGMDFEPISCICPVYGWNFRPLIATEGEGQDGDGGEKPEVLWTFGGADIADFWSTDPTLIDLSAQKFQAGAKIYELSSPYSQQFETAYAQLDALYAQADDNGLSPEIDAQIQAFYTNIDGIQAAYTAYDELSTQASARHDELIGNQTDIGWTFGSVDIPDFWSTDATLIDLSAKMDEASARIIKVDLEEVGVGLDVFGDGGMKLEDRRDQLPR